MPSPDIDTSVYTRLSDKVSRAVQYAEQKNRIDTVRVRENDQPGRSGVYIETTGEFVPNALIQQVNRNRLKVKRIKAQFYGTDPVVDAKFEVKPAELE